MNVHVQPRGSRNEIANVQGEALQILLIPPPVKGAANTTFRGCFATPAWVPRGNEGIVSGEKMRRRKF